VHDHAVGGTQSHGLELESRLQHCRPVHDHIVGSPVAGDRRPRCGGQAGVGLVLSDPMFRSETSSKIPRRPERPAMPRMMGGGLGSCHSAGSLSPGRDRRDSDRRPGPARRRWPRPGQLPLCREPAGHGREPESRPVTAVTGVTRDSDPLRAFRPTGRKPTAAGCKTGRPLLFQRAMTDSR
jgi:hypothetical protein